MAKYLSQFNKFDWDAFAKDKSFLATGVSNWLDFDTKKRLGTKIPVVIDTDNTVYKHKDGETGSNLYEKLDFKIPKDVNVPVNSHVIPVNPVVTIYGEYRNQISVKADDIKVVQQTQKP